jgi:hypothetical protein
VAGLEGASALLRVVAAAVVRVDEEEIPDMSLTLAVLVAALILAGGGFALQVLWIVAAALLVIWLLGFLVSGAEHSWFRVEKK